MKNLRRIAAGTVLGAAGYPPGVEAALGIIAAKIARSQGVLR
ncbi:hypothetical protein [Yimella sp. cx-51]|nr:hypothetical protein [Yimella sp. cx-51]